MHLKAECFQRGGSFKFRGAYNKIASLAGDARARGVLAYSSGNHAQAVAIAARLLGTRATIVMPEDAPTAKLDATRGYGAEIVTTTAGRENREEIGARLAAERGLELVRPYDDPLVMAGQGTVGARAARGRARSRRARRAGRRRRADRRLRDRREGAAAGDPRRRRRAGDGGRHAALARSRASASNVGVPRTIADGLQAPEPGELTFEVNRELVDEFVTVSDAEIVDAMAFLFDRLKLVSSRAAPSASRRCSQGASPGSASGSSSRAGTSALRASPSSSALAAARPRRRTSTTWRSRCGDRSRRRRGAGRAPSRSAAPRFRRRRRSPARPASRSARNSPVSLAALDDAAGSRRSASRARRCAAAISALRAISRTSTRTTSGWCSQPPSSIARDAPQLLDARTRRVFSTSSQRGRGGRSSARGRSCRAPRPSTRSSDRAGRARRPPPRRCRRRARCGSPCARTRRTAASRIRRRFSSATVERSTKAVAGYW